MLIYDCWCWTRVKNEVRWYMSVTNTRRYNRHLITTPKLCFTECTKEIKRTNKINFKKKHSLPVLNLFYALSYFPVLASFFLPFLIFSLKIFPKRSKVYNGQAQNMYNVQKNQRNSTLKPALHHFFYSKNSCWTALCCTLFIQTSS